MRGRISAELVRIVAFDRPGQNGIIQDRALELELYCAKRTETDRIR
jgi:hypothetical protein